MTNDHAPTGSPEPCNCEQALALQQENARLRQEIDEWREISAQQTRGLAELREALAALLAQSGDPNAVTGEFDTAAGRARRLLQPDKAIDYAWPQDAEGLLAMAREWGGVEGDDLRAADVLICKLGQALGAATCTDSPPWFKGHWRDWHRGHWCPKDDGKPRTPEGAAEIEAHR